MGGEGSGELWSLDAFRLSNLGKKKILLYGIEWFFFWRFYYFRHSIISWVRWNFKRHFLRQEIKYPVYRYQKVTFNLMGASTGGHSLFVAIQLSFKYYKCLLMDISVIRIPLYEVQLVSVSTLCFSVDDGARIKNTHTG